MRLPVRLILACLLALLPFMASAQTTIDVQGRKVLVHAPSRLPASPALVLVLHGGGGSADTAYRQIHPTLGPLANQRGFVVAYPEAGTRWNDGRAGTASGANDVAWLRTVVDTLVQTRRVDRRRVFVTGLSNGAIMAYRLACEAPDLVAAIAPVAGNRPADAPACTQAVPMQLIEGTMDRLAPHPGGRSAAAGQGGEPVTLMLSAWDTVRQRAATNGCRTQTRTSTLSSTATRYEFLGCRAPVRYIEVRGGGHTWPTFASAEVVAFFRGLGL
jgi:polyhydroxybutyrate depolymerase